jgi:hypothetical protein
MYSLLTYSDSSNVARSGLDVGGAVFDILKAADAMGKELPGYRAIDIVRDWANSEGLMSLLAEAAAAGKLNGAEVGSRDRVTL